MTKQIEHNHEFEERKRANIHFQEEERAYEDWKDIPGYEGYQASTHGNIKSLKRGKTTILKLMINNKGYYKVSLYKNGKLETKEVAPLIAMTFKNHTPCGYDIVVDHMDNNPLNNHVDNLQLISHRENASKDRKGTSEHTGVSWNKAERKWRATIRDGAKCIHIGFYDDEEEAADAYIKALDKMYTHDTPRNKGETMKIVYTPEELRSIDAGLPMEVWDQCDTAIHVMNYNEPNRMGKLENMEEVAKLRKLKWPGL